MATCRSCFTVGGSTANSSSLDLINSMLCNPGLRTPSRNFNKISRCLSSLGSRGNARTPSPSRSSKKALTEPRMFETGIFCPWCPDPRREGRLVKHKRPSFFCKKIDHLEEDLIGLGQTSLLVHVYAHNGKPRIDVTIYRGKYFSGLKFLHDGSAR